MDVDLRHLRALVAAADEGSFTAAGAALGLSQAAVSRAIAALERGVGATLVERTTRRMALTPTGERAVAHARRAIAAADAVQRVAADARAEIRIGYAWAALGEHTTAAQHRWAQRHPGSALRFVQVIRPTAGLAEGVVDLAVLRREPEGARWATALIGVEPRVAALAADDPLARRADVSLRELADRVIALDRDTGTTTPALWPPGAGPATTLEVHSVDEWLTLIAAGEAVGVTAAATARQHPKPGVAYRPVRDAQPIPVLLAWPRAAPPDAVADVLALACELYGA